VLPLLLLPMACGRAPEVSPAAPPERPKVLASFTVVADMAREVACANAVVESITKPGAEIHEYEPTPGDVVKAQHADLVLWNGLGLERWFERFFGNLKGVPEAVLSEGIPPIGITEGAYSGKPNPHAWMSPRLAQRYVDRLVVAFSALDPAGTAAYRANGEAYKRELGRLDAELRAALEAVPPRQRLLVSCEGAFSYLARDYGLEEAYLWPVNAESQVTPRRMARLIDTVKQRQVPAVFCESTVSNKPQLEVARAGGSRYGGTFFVDSLSGPSGPAPSLLALQRHNVSLIVRGLLPAGESR